MFNKKDSIVDRWPKREDGEPISPAFLMHVGGTETDAMLTISLLEAYNIPVVKQFPNNGEFGKVVIGLSGTGIDLYVPETQLEEARELLDGEPQVEE